MQTLGVTGFVLVLAGWFAMFWRVRRDFPNRSVSEYGTYTGPRVSGVKIMGRSGWSLVIFYWKHYGLDVWSSVTALGVILIVIAAFAGRS